MQKIVVTGGHLTPALAVIDALPNKMQVLFIGRKFSSKTNQTISHEKQSILKRQHEFATITEVKFDRYNPFLSLILLPNLFKCIWQAHRLISRYKPHVVVTFGGYIGVPVCIVAWYKRIPIILHEQTASRGLANRIIAPMASYIRVGFPSTVKWYPQSKTSVVGNPIRQEIVNPPQNPPLWLSKNQKPIIYITGGNQGSHQLNQLLFELLPQLVQKYRLIHQTGASRANADFHLSKKYRSQLSRNLQADYVPRPWFEVKEVSYILHHAHFVLSRSGANTVSELAVVGVPAIFIPLPFASQNEQWHNASILKEAKAAMILDSQTVTNNSLLEAIEALEKNYGSFIHYAKINSQTAQIHLYASQKLATLISQLSQKEVEGNAST